MKYFSGTRANAVQRIVNKSLPYLLTAALVTSTIMYGCKRDITAKFTNLTQSELFQAGSKIAKNKTGKDIKKATLWDVIEIEKEKNVLRIISYKSTDGKATCKIYAAKQDDGTFIIVPDELVSRVLASYLSSE